MSWRSIKFTLADHTYALAAFGEAEHNMVSEVHSSANAVGLWINVAKTKVLSAHVNPPNRGIIDLEEISSWEPPPCHEIGPLEQVAMLEPISLPSNTPFASIKT